MGLLYLIPLVGGPSYQDDRGLVAIDLGPYTGASRSGQEESAAWLGSAIKRLDAVRVESLPPSHPGLQRL